jgi:hypothetical protein
MTIRIFLWKFRKIVSHQGPLKKDHPDYKGSLYNLIVEWESGETTIDPLQLITADDPVSCAIYARENNLLDKPGWKRFKGIPKQEKYSLGWVILQSYGHSIQHHISNMVMRFLITIIMEYNLMRRMEMTCGRMPANNGIPNI